MLFGFDEKESKGNGATPYPGNGGTTVFDVHAHGRNERITVVMGSDGKPDAVFARPLFLGLF